MHHQCRRHSSLSPWHDRAPRDPAGQRPAEEGDGQRACTGNAAARKQRRRHKAPHTLPGCRYILPKDALRQMLISTDHLPVTP